MAHTTRTGNFSVSSVEFGVNSGTNIADAQSTALLTLIPDPGFTLDAADFSYTSGPSQVASVTFAQSGVNVIATVTFATGAVMPSNDLDIPICISGDSGLVEYTLSGIIEVISSANVAPATSNIPYTASGNEGDDSQVFSQTITAAEGYYFPTAPTGHLASGNPNSYLFGSSIVTNNDGEITAKTFTGDYTFGSSSVSGDVFTIVAEAALIPVVVREITSYSISTSNIRGAGETRAMTIFGAEGAQFSLTVVNEDETSILTSPLTNITIPATGAYSFNMTFPAVTDNDDYDFVLTGDLASTFDTVEGQPSTFTLNQYVDIDLTFQLVTTNPDLTPGAPVVLEYVPDTDLENGDSNYNFTGSLTVISTSPITELAPPQPNSFTNLDPANNGGTDTTITSVSSALSNSNLTYTITFEGITEQTGIQDVISQINLEFLIVTNNIPLANELTHTVIEDTPKTITLSAFDADGDALTYTIISGPSNGTFYESNGGAEITSYPHILPGNTVWYEPDLNYYGSDNFTVQVSDGTSDSNIATNYINVTEVNDLPVISHTPWTEGNYLSNPNPVNTHVFEEGDAFTATAIATDVEDPATDLTWSIISEFDAIGSGETTTPDWITGTTNADGSFTIAADGTGIRAGNTTFYIKVVDTDGGFDTQIVQLGGIVPTLNSYFKFIFDASGSMDETLGYLKRDFIGIGGVYSVANAPDYTVVAYNDPYNNPECLRYYLQDFYATGLTEAQGNTDTTTNGADQFDLKVSVAESGFEHPHRILANIQNGVAGFSTDATGEFPGAESVVIASFMDEANQIGLGDGGGDQYPADGVANQTGIDHVTNLKATINSLKNNKGTGFYRGLFYPVEVNGQTTAESALEQYYKASVNNTDQFDSSSINPPYAGVENLNEHGYLTASSNVELLDDGNTTPGYYTKRVVNDLIALGYEIPAYAGTN